MPDRFNRYMVECEFADVMGNGDYISFNRYMVECEFLISTLSKFSVNSINRYMVECELL